MGPPESVHTIIITYYQHREEIFANLESLQASQAIPGEGIFKLLCHPTKVATSMDMNFARWQHEIDDRSDFQNVYVQNQILRILCIIEIKSVISKILGT